MNEDEIFARIKEIISLLDADEDLPQGVELETVLPELLGYAKSKKSGVRESAIEALGEIDDPKASAAVAAAIHDRNPMVRLEAVCGSEFVELDVRRAMLERSLHDPYELVRIEAIELLADIDPEASCAEAVKALADKDWLVRALSAALLGEIGSEKHKLILEQHVAKDHSSYVRVHVWYALYRLGDKDQLTNLLRGLKSKKYLVRYKASQLLAQIVDSENIGSIRASLTRALALEEEWAVAPRGAIQKALTDIAEWEAENA